MSQDGVVCNQCLGTTPVQPGQSKQEAQQEHQSQFHTVEATDSAKGADFRAMADIAAASLGNPGD